MSVITCFINPTIGDDSTGSPIQNGKSVMFYKTLDACIDENSLNEDDTLVCDCSGGSVSLDNPRRYSKIRILSSDRSSNLFINSHSEKSITLDDTTLDMDTTVVLKDAPENVPAGCSAPRRSHCHPCYR